MSVSEKQCQCHFQLELQLQFYYEAALQLDHDFIGVWQRN